MEKFTSKLVIFFVLAIVFIMGVMFPYRSVFDGSLSTVPSDWGAFGSYLSGTLGPIFSFLSILAVVFVADHQIKSSKSDLENELEESRNQLETQIKEQRRQDHIRSLELRVQSILDLLVKIQLETRAPYHLLPDYIELLGGKEKIIVEERNKHFVFIDKFTNVRKYLPHGTIFSIYNGFETEFGVDAAQRILIDEDRCGFLSEYRSYAETGNHLLIMMQQLLDEDYDLRLVRHMLSQPFNAFELLYQKGLFSQVNMNIIRTIMSWPVEQLATFKLGPYQETIVSIFNKTYGQELTVDDFDFAVMGEIDELNKIKVYKFKVKANNNEYRYSTVHGISKVEI
ncbi:hypothetical protein [Vibrio crassostreae]|uniref:hypothetical protein n=1 Tax=Vibrio crassostreae TaxID=246167 RepID=UPI001BD51750|nr:hypothetical protein [Vibrio crassostreae]